VSEYQCYEFVALDRRLTAKEMAELRSISTRAEITPTRFWNEYHWGDLKADPAKLLARYFDMHLYFANWGTRRLMFRLPVQAVDLDALRACLPGEPATLTTTDEAVRLVVDLREVAVRADGPGGVRSSLGRGPAALRSAVGVLGPAAPRRPGAGR